MYLYLSSSAGHIGIKVIVGVLLVFYIVLRFFMPDEPEELQNFSLQAEVISDSRNTAEAAQSAVGFKLIKLRLPDGTHAYVSGGHEQHAPGDRVDVVLSVMDDGSRRVHLPDF